MTIHRPPASPARLMLSDAIDGLRASKEALAAALMADLHRRFTQPQVDQILQHMLRLNIERQMQDSPRPDPGLTDPESAPRPDHAPLYHALTVTDAAPGTLSWPGADLPQDRFPGWAHWALLALLVAALAAIGWAAAAAQLHGLALFDGVARHG